MLTSKEWVEEFFTKLYWNLFMKRTDLEIEKEALFMRDMANDYILKNKYDLSLLIENQKSSTKILDTCCGVGDLAQYLTKYAKVSGIELSDDYLKESKIYAPHVDMKHGSVLDYQLNETFDIVYNWNSSFAYFTEEKDQQFLNNCFKWTKEGGVFILEMFNSYQRLIDFIEIQKYQTSYHDKIYYTERISKIDYLKRRMLQTWKIKEEDGTEYIYDTFTTLYMADEVTKLMEKVGFSNIEIMGRDKQKELCEFSSKSHRLIVKGYKKNEIV